LRGVSAGALTALVIAALADCSGADRPPSAPVLSGPIDSGADVTMASDDTDASTKPPPHDASLDTSSADDADDGATDEGATEDAPAEAATIPPGGCSSQSDADVIAMLCAGHCVNVAIDNNNCGGCNQLCGTVPGTSCVTGQCVCPVPQTVCNGQCVDTTQDVSNCGFCGHNCTGSPCSGGLCQASLIAQTVQGGVLPATVAAAIAVDSNYVYWTQAPGVGTEPGVFQKAFAGGAPNGPWGSPDPRGLAVSGHNVYWADYQTRAVNAGSLIAGPSGGVTPLAAGSGPLAVATDGQNVYWTDSTAGTINQTALAGANAGSTLVLAANRSFPVAIAVDATNVYWIDNGTLANTGSVNRVPIGVANAITPIATSENLPWALALYPPFTSQTSTPPAATTVYWTNQTNPGTVKSAKTATPGAAPTVIAPNQLAPYGIAVDSQYVYWTNFDGNTVVKAPLAGGAEYVLASGANLNIPTSIAVDSVNVYWANQGNGTIFKVAK
jgi:hypothetical protein